jgi:hypothetical protein
VPRGGKRSGRPGSAYSNRSDLRVPLPAAAPTNQPYGQAGRQLAAQQAVPMAPTPLAAAAGGQPVAPNPVQPGQFGPLDRPTDRPDEPITAGMPFGPGAGPEALTAGPVVMGRSLSSVIADAASSSGSPELAQLAQRARALGQ